MRRRKPVPYRPCVTVNVCPPKSLVGMVRVSRTLTVAWRARPDWLGLAVKVTALRPLTVAMLVVNQTALLVADKLQPGADATVNLPEPPPATTT